MHPVFPYGYEQTSLVGHASGSQNRTLRDKQAGTRKKGVKTKVMLGQKQGIRYGIFITEAIRVYSLIQRNHLHGDLPTKLNNYIFYYKHYCGHSTTSPETPENRSVPPFKTSEKHNGYLKGVAPMDAQQKNMELLAFSCSRDSSWLGAPLPRYGRHGRKKSHQTL